jgi:capsule polysaccharide export protein KpsE/RkpR
MSFAGRSPVQPRVPELPQHELPIKPGTEEAPQENMISVAYMRLFWEHRGLLTKVGLCGFLASIVLALWIPSRFESTARLMPPDNNQSGGLAMAAAALSGGGGGGGMGMGGLAGEVLGLKSSSEIFVGILSSRTTQDKLIQELDLKKLYGASRMDDARRALATHTGISVDRKSQIITLSTSDHDPARAAAMGQAYIEELNHLVAELSTSSARRERIFLEQRLQAVNKDLESAEKEFSQYASKNSAIDIKEQGKAMVEAAATLQGELIATQSELEGLRQIYTDNNVRVRSVRARIAELNHQLENIGGKGENSSIPANEQPDSLYPSIRKLPLLGVTYADLYRRTKVQEAVFETLTKEYELAKVQEVKEIPAVKVLDIPNVPDRKSFPPRSLIVILGTGFAVVMGMAWVFGKTSWEQRDSADPRWVFAEEVISTARASIPGFGRNGASHHSGEGDSIGLVPKGREDDEAPN